MVGRRCTRCISGIMMLIVSLLFAGCVTIGRPFPVGAVSMIRKGESTRQQIGALFGAPWRTGIEDGNPTWTYAHYRYGLFGGGQTRDLIVRFDEKGVVVSYTFNSSYPEDAAR